MQDQIMKKKIPIVTKLPDYFSAECLCNACKKRVKRKNQIVCDWCHKHMNDPKFYDK